MTSVIPSDLDPIVVTSPTIRAGTTLVQRLLCSSPDTLIYGEECGKDLEVMMTIIRHKVGLYRLRAETMRELRRKVLGGSVDEWIVDLMPDLDRYMDAFQGLAFAGLAACRDDAIAAGRLHWGFKYPGLSPATIDSLRRQMPRLRLVAIRRDLASTLRSAKAWSASHAELDTRNFCREWAMNSAYLDGLTGDPSVLIIDFDHLARDRNSVIQSLAAFTGAKAIDASVANERIDGLVRPGGLSYSPPAELTEAELSIVAETIRA